MARQDAIVAEAAGLFLNSFKRPVRLLVAVSGGSDSTGLLLALAGQRASGRYPGLSLHACTVDHGLRRESAREAQWVEALCARYGIAHVTRRWMGEKPASGLQAAARAERYALLDAVAAGIGADAVLTAHTLDDQRETVAMRAGRAAAGIGLAGMADAVLLNGRTWLLRPFLSLSREDVRDFLTGLGEAWLDDPSNANRRFERVRVREAKTDTARPAGAGERLSGSLEAAAFLEGSVGHPARGLFLLDPAAVRRACDDAAAWRGLLALAAVAGGRVHRIETETAARVRVFLAGGTLTRLTAGRVVFDRRSEGLYLYRESRGIAACTVPPGETGVWDGRFEIANRSCDPLHVEPLGTARLDGALRGVFRRARLGAPHVVDAGGVAAPPDAFALRPVVAPYRHFLPRFDLPLAQALARIVGLAPFPSPPNE